MNTNELVYLTVDEIKDPKKGSIAIGPFGSRMKSDRYVSHGVPILRGNNISNTKSLKGNFVYVSPKTADELKTNNVFPEDLFFPHRGLIGEVGIVPSDGADRYVISSSLMKLTCNKDVIIPTFLFYFFRSPKGRHELLKHASTVGTPGIGQPLTSLRSIRVPVPSLPVQQYISHVIGELDEKIELNQQMNKTLEEIGQRIFNHWFIDFEFPNEKHKPYKSSGGKMIKTELGEIPESWYTDIAENVFRLEYGWHLPKWERKEGKFPVFGSGGLTGFHNKSLVEGPGVILGRAGKIGKDSIYYSHRDFCPIETTFFVKTKNKILISYLYFFLKTIPIVNSGSSVPNVSRSHIHNLKIKIPPINLIKKFAMIMKNLFDLIYKNNEEIKILFPIRNSLLPKLMSGKMKLPIEVY